MTCEEVVVALMASYDEGPAAERSAALDEHVAGCPSCTAFDRTYAATIRLTRAAFERPAPAEEREAIAAWVLDRLDLDAG